jgi:hypothetical protein
MNIRKYEMVIIALYASFNFTKTLLIRFLCVDSFLPFKYGSKFIPFFFYFIQSEPQVAILVIKNADSQWKSKISIVAYICIVFWRYSRLFFRDTVYNPSFFSIGQSMYWFYKSKEGPIAWMLLVYNYLFTSSLFHSVCFWLSDTHNGSALQNFFVCFQWKSPSL